MKQYSKIQFIFILVFISNLAVAQVGGNQVYQANRNNSRNHPLHYSINNHSISSTDSTLIVGATVLLNKKADYYLFTLSAKANNKTVIQCNKNLNRRIGAFMKDIAKKGINRKNVYVDFVSQIKVYDHKIEGEHIIEFFDGFEIRKNIIIKLKDLNLVDEIIELASKQSFFDIVKLDYHNQEVDKIYDQLFDDAMKIIGKKKAKFLKNSNVSVQEKYRIASVNLAKYLPKNMYNKYDEAFASSTVNTHYSRSYIKKEVRKEKTFYYDGIDNNLLVDKVIDNLSPIVGIQYLMSISVIYRLNK
ncbi:hypothetical protein BKI52_22595 [marine bacterium AO1-C]|nr:hypothetical protein BKI52_22595 [marine bacterium AO1-C]